MTIETVCKTPWISLKKVVAPEKDIHGYYFSHEERSNGCIIAVLPYRRTAEGYEYMVKSEVTPCWSLIPVLSALTGGWEGGRPVEDAQRELEEESGYVRTEWDFISLGESYASKSADTRYSLFAVDLTGVEPGEVKGDGSALEASALSLWLSETALLAVEDPQVHVMFNRLRHRLP